MEAILLVLSGLAVVEARQVLINARTRARFSRIFGDEFTREVRLAHRIYG